MRFIIIILIFVSSAVFADVTMSPAPALTPTLQTTPLNETTVAIADQSATSLQLGLQAAFSDVMVKMSGNPAIMSAPPVQAASKNVMQWLQSYAYIPQTTAVSPEKPAWVLQVVFNKTGLEQLLQTVQQTAVSTEVPPSIVQVT